MKSVISEIRRSQSRLKNIIPRSIIGSWDEWTPYALQSILDKAIDALPEKHRLVFILRDVVGMHIEETDKTLGISIENVKVPLLRARLTLGETLTQQFGDEGIRLFHKHDHEGDQSNITSAQLLLQSYPLK